MNSIDWLSGLPALAGLVQIPWFIGLSIARVRHGGTSALPKVKLIDFLIPLPAYGGFLLAAVLLWKTGGHGNLWLWSGGVVCAAMSLLFAWITVKGIT